MKTVEPIVLDREGNEIHAPSDNARDSSSTRARFAFNGRTVRIGPVWSVALALLLPLLLFAGAAFVAVFGAILLVFWMIRGTLRAILN